MDLPLYELEEDKYLTASVSSTDILPQSLLSSSPTADISVLAGKVTKYLLTRRGTDLISPMYGCYLMDYTQLPRTRLPQFQLEVISAIASCTKFIKSSESVYMDDSTRLQSIELTGLEYNKGEIKDQVEIYLKVTNIPGTTIILNVPV